MLIFDLFKSSINILASKFLPSPAPRGVLSFFLHTQARAQHLPITPKKYQEFQAPQKKIFEILATPILYFDLKKRHENS